MADLSFIGYPDESTADEAAAGARRLAKDLMLEKVTPDKAVDAMSRYRATVLKTSLSQADEQELQEALHGQQAAAQ